MTQTAPYIYRPYPKWIKNNHGKDVLVQNNKEHRESLGELYIHNPEWDTEEIQEESTMAMLEDAVKEPALFQYAKANDLLPCDVPDAIPTGVIGVPVYANEDPLATDLIDISNLPASNVTSPISAVELPKEDEKETLLKQADVLGIYYDKRWGASKLKATIDAAIA